MAAIHLRATSSAACCPLLTLSLTSSPFLVHLQNRWWVTKYSDAHETSYLRPRTFQEGAPGFGSGPALLRCFRLAPLPNPSSQLQGRAPAPDSRKPRLRTADRAQRHPRVQRARPWSPEPRFLAPRRGTRRFRRGRGGGPAGDVAPFPEGVWKTEEHVDAGGRRAGELRGGP